MNRRHTHPALGWSAVVFAGLGFTACGGATRWWMFQADLRHGGHNPGLSSRLPHTLRWSVPLVTGSVQLTPPVFGKGKILIGSSAGDGKLYALSPGNGSTLWSFTAPAGDGFEGAAAAVGGRVFAATSGPSPHAYALDEATGAVVWQTPLAAPNHASSALANGRLFIFDYLTVKALDATTGAVIWAYTPVAAGGATPVGAMAVGDRLVYYSDYQLIRGVDGASGTLAWQAPIPGNGNPNSPGNSPGIEFELLVVPNKGYVYAFR